LKYAAIKCRFSGPVASQPALPWIPFWAPAVGGLSSCQPPSTKMIGPPGTELRHILAVHIMCPVILTYFLQNWITWPGGGDEHTLLFGSFFTFSFLKYEAIICRFSGLVARQPVLPWQPFWAPLLSGRGGGRPYVSPEYEVDRTTRYWVKACYNCTHYVPVWPWHLI